MVLRILVEVDRNQAGSWDVETGFSLPHSGPIDWKGPPNTAMTPSMTRNDMNQRYQ